MIIRWLAYVVLIALNGKTNFGSYTRFERIKGDAKETQDKSGHMLEVPIGWLLYDMTVLVTKRMKSQMEKA